MSYTQNTGRSSGDSHGAGLARDAALGRVKRTRRWVIGGTAGVTAGFAVLVAAVAPGRTSGSNVQSSSRTAQVGSASSGSTSEPQLPTVASPGSLGLSSPDQAPTASSTPSDQSSSSSSSSASSQSSGSGGGAVVSGGS
jgi:hypothetical protein